jgi:hypothetical protein
LNDRQAQSATKSNRRKKIGAAAHTTETAARDDGIPEAQSTTQAMFGVERMLATVRANLDQPAEVMQATLLDAVRRFVGKAPQFDDMTVLFAVRGPM